MLLMLHVYTAFIEFPRYFFEHRLQDLDVMRNEISFIAIFGLLNGMVHRETAACWSRSASFPFSTASHTSGAHIVQQTPNLGWFLNETTHLVPQEQMKEKTHPNPLSPLPAVFQYGP